MAAEPTAGASQVYTWEPSNAAIARRYGLERGQIVRFDTNTAATPPEGIEALLCGPFDPPLNEYPDSSYEDLTAAIARYAGVMPTEVLVAAGADEALDICAKTFLSAGTAALVPVPTYAMYGVLTSQREARIVAVPRLGPEAGFALDLDRLAESLPTAHLVWLCAPNNPTGAPEPAGAIEQVLQLAGRTEDAAGAPVVVVDEAYHEFTGQTVVALRSRHPNLVVVRTLSKGFALAGIRVGYAIATRETIARLERLRPPGSISTISAQLAAAALADPSIARRAVAAVAAERGRLADGLAGIGWTPLPSVTNFVLVRVGDHGAAEVAADRLLRAGIVPRTFGPANPLRGHLRLTVRSRSENDRLLEVLAA
ncbi:MAG TPA: aminotransferase class I/II-fold pyridoxal phosphate-dependent enzyme [Candidatus Limnocylindrales bacterium]|jgi:histidinol-phosphate aminotransferase|nr:aminotransferase class I/II-fold pyridoxal phosphate-dependent enzyme [Candidatus Limnocylindrales bacterium]